MLLLILFAFLAGIVTILSPCILPLLPVILATSAVDNSSRRRPYGIVVGFILSFTFFTLFLSLLVKQLGIPAEFLRQLSVGVIAFFGLSLLIPRFQLVLENLFARLANLIPSSVGKTGLPAQAGFGGGLLIGLSLGLLWTPCVGPILASVIALALSGSVTTEAILITLAYSLGTAIPMYGVIKGGQQLFTRVPWLLRNTMYIQHAFGLVMILVAGLIYFGFDRNFQTYILTKFPAYGAGLTQFEDRAFVKDSPSVSLMQKGMPAPELIAGGQWFNSDPLTLAKLKGKVVLIDFWTYTCINCQRTLPYLKAWHNKYEGNGLVIIGVHAPEFEFEKDAGNVSEAITDFGLTYPVMQDNDFATWRAYKNRYWPAKYLIDAEGNIRYTHFGEGDYDETERAIQELLSEAGQTVDQMTDNPQYQTYGKTPELYLGSARYSPLSPITRQGQWTVEDEYALASPGSEMTLKYNAKSVYLVMRPTAASALVEVYLDQKLIDTITVDKQTLYTLVNLESPGSHTLRLVFPDGNVELYAFTFG